MAKREHIYKNSIETNDVIDGAITKEKLDPRSLQAGRTSVSFPFAVAGEENVSATITFPTAFEAPPSVAASVEGIDVGIVSITSTATDFTIVVRDDKGTDYTTSQTATINWIAIKV